MSIRLDLKNKRNEKFLEPHHIEELIGTTKSFIFRPNEGFSVAVYSDNDNGQWVVFSPEGVRTFEEGESLADYLYYHDNTDITEDDFKFCDFEIIVKEV